MTEQPPVQHPKPPSGGTAGQQGAGNPPTQPMSGATGAATGPPPVPPQPVAQQSVAQQRNIWRQATSTRRGRWGIGIGAAALAILMLLGIGAAALAVMRVHDRVAFIGDRRDGTARGHDGPDFRRDNRQDNRSDKDRGPGADDRNRRRMQPGMPGGQGPGGLGGILNGGVLHGQMTASVDGSVQALLFQRGEITAVSATAITLKSSDGFAATYGLTAATLPRAQKFAAVKGGQAFVLARASDKVAIRVTAGKTSLR